MSEFMVRLTKKSGPLSEDGGDDNLSLHKAVAKALPTLDRLTGQLGLKPLAAFLSEDPDNVFDLVDDEDEAEKILSKLPPVKWFSPESALPTVEGLLSHFDAGNPIEGIKNPAKVIAELRNLDVILKFGIRKKAKFRFYQEF